MNYLNNQLNDLVKYRLSTPLGILILVCVSFFVGYLCLTINWGIGLAIAIAVVAIPFLLSLFVRIKLSIYFFIGLSIFIGIPFKLNLPFPIGLSFDFGILLTILGHLYKCGEEKDFKTTFDVPLLTPLLLWVVWNIFQIANPFASSRVAWFYVMRPYVLYPILYFITYYYFRTISDIKSLLFFLLCSCFFSAFWGDIQNVFGYFPFEMEWVYANDAKHLVYISGRWRVFGTLSSPAHFGMLVAIVIVISAVISTSYNWGRKIVLFIGICICLPALIWSGTRSGIAILVIAGALVVLTWGNVKIYIVGGIIGFLFFLLVITPSNNYHIQRIQSTFAGSKDTSYNEREENRKAIYPWVWKHPLGGGIGSTGVWGAKFSPGTMLANFAPDSGHIRILVEEGPLGLIFYLSIYVSFILYSLKYSKIWLLKDNELKVTFLTLFASLASFLVVEQVQDVNGILPFSIIIWIFLALMMRTLQLIRDYHKGNYDAKKKKENDELLDHIKMKEIKRANYEKRFKL
ncbi:O-antigen ligase domain-containing protein [Flammeovirga pectinis]|uniref:O-antigen ligase domain-containing protein n=1 Tax=Flammeovirga pectinis TaxID=2494373 RepID=A0A3Q9FSV2_9BACT|nr:O-antigen ligase family protein [Flammeovirga pectinis]AZQ65286.1 O-antigen ligase domain-containing protein [Flammeovirga pectinis]